jgi:hypothetical protein
MKSLHKDRSVYREEFVQATARHPNPSSAPPEEGTQRKFKLPPQAGGQMELSLSA